MVTTCDFRLPRTFYKIEFSINQVAGKCNYISYMGNIKEIEYYSQAVVQYLCLCIAVIIVGGLFQTSWDQKPSVLPPGTLISFSIKQRKKSISAALLRYLTFNKAPHHSISQPVLPVISLILIISSWLLSNTSQTVSSVAAASASGQLMKHSNTAWSSLVQPSSAQLCQVGVAKKCWRALIKPPRSNIFSILQIFQIVCTGFMTQYSQVNQGERYQRYQR